MLPERSRVLRRTPLKNTEAHAERKPLVYLQMDSVIVQLPVHLRDAPSFEVRVLALRILPLQIVLRQHRVRASDLQKIPRTKAYLARHLTVGIRKQPHLPRLKEVVPLVFGGILQFVLRVKLDVE